MTKFMTFIVGLTLILAPLIADAAHKWKCPRRPNNEVRAHRLAKKFFAKGDKFARKQKHAKALDSFLCSLRMKAHENTVYNVAQVSKFIEDRQTVLDRLQLFLDKHPDHDSTQEIEELIDSVDDTSQPTDTTSAPTPVPSLVEPTVDEAVEDKPEDETDEAEAEPPAPTPEDDPTPEPLDAPIDDEVPGMDDSSDDEALTDEKQEGAPPTKIAGYTLLGVAGGALIAAAALQGAAGAARNEALDSTNYAQFTAREDKLSSRQTGATVCWVLTGVFAATGVVLLLLDTDEEESDGVAVEVEPGAAGLTLRWRF